MKVEIAPLKGKISNMLPWEGECVKKPWNYKVTAMIPCLGTYDLLKTNIELLRLQTESPYIMLIDTGSANDELEKIQSLASEDVEVHCLRLNGVMHPSDFPAMAMDVAFSLCRTRYAFATHADCFIRRRNLLEDMIDMTNISSVVGYEITPRAHSDWQGMVSHTATMYDMEVMDKIGFGWSLRRLANIYGMKSYKPNPLTPNWPDTEILGNYILRKNKIEPLLIGKEHNFKRTIDDNIDHCRSITSGKLYSPTYYAKAKQWADDAMAEAQDRINQWKGESFKTS